MSLFKGNRVLIVIIVLSLIVLLLITEFLFENYLLTGESNVNSENMSSVSNGKPDIINLVSNSDMHNFHKASKANLDTLSGFRGLKFGTSYSYYFDNYDISSLRLSRISKYSDLLDVYDFHLPQLIDISQVPEGNIRAFQYDTIGANVSLFFYMDTLRKIEISASTILSGRQNSIDGDMIDIFKESVTVLLGEADRVIRLDCYDNNGLLSKEMARKKIEKAEQFRRNNKGQLNPYLNFSCEYEYQWRTNKTELRLIYMFRVYRRLDYSILQLAYNERINREINSIDIKIKEEIRINNIINDSIKKVEEIKKRGMNL